MDRLINAFNVNKNKDYHFVASAVYHKIYADWSNYDNLTKTYCLNDVPQTTFAELMSYFMGDAKNLNDFIRYDLLKECVGNKQKYFELILACMTMANVFHEWGADKEGKICNDWYFKLFYNKKTYTKYVTEEELSDLWGLR